MRATPAGGMAQGGRGVRRHPCLHATAAAFAAAFAAAACSADAAPLRPRDGEPQRARMPTTAAGSACLRRLGRAPDHRGRPAVTRPRHALPAQFDWRNPHGNGSYVTAVRNQFLPGWCGSCWAQAVTSSLSDRLKIIRIREGTHLADIDLSPQPLLDCGIADDTK